MADGCKGASMELGMNDRILIGFFIFLAPIYIPFIIFYFYLSIELITEYDEDRDGFF
jgi:hypothetical protein